jgi:hypothetical protein
MEASRPACRLCSRASQRKLSKRKICEAKENLTKRVRGYESFAWTFFDEAPRKAENKALQPVRRRALGARDKFCQVKILAPEALGEGQVDLDRTSG